MTVVWKEPKRRRQGERMRMMDRKRHLLETAIPLAEKHGFEHVSRGMVALEAGVAPSLLSSYWTAPDFQTALMEEAIARENLVLVAQGLTARHPAALAAPITLRWMAVKHLIEE